MSEMYAGHTTHCECEKIAKETERAYARIVLKNNLLERVARAAEKHHHVSDEKECAICIYLRELHK